MIADEIPLTGGRITSGIVKIGNTVHRPRSKNSPFVHSLLQHLEKIAFTGAPRFLGIDDKSREILSYLNGAVPAELAWFSDDQLKNAAKLIRRYHNATVKMAQQNHAEVICHNDLSPCNFVFSSDLPYAMIDFDAAAPGSRISDLSYAAWMWLDIGNPDIIPQEQKRRLHLFCEAYGEPFNHFFIEAMLQRQMQIIKEGENQLHLEMGTWAKNCYEWTKICLVDR